jgi:hypothetical protein
LWRRWREAVDFDAISWECQQLLPALAGHFPRWLEGDAYASRIQGIVKMVWSRNQVRLNKAAELQQSLLRASAGPVAFTGPLAWSLLTREEGSVRSIPMLSLLIPRRQIRNAIEALNREGWQLCGNPPDRETLDWSCYVPLAKGDETFHLHWRLAPFPARDTISRERAFMKRLRTIVWNRYEFQVLSAEGDLVDRLTERPAWDPVPRQADVLMMPFAGVDWRRFRRLAPPEALEWLMECRREWQLPIPEIASQDRPMFFGLVPHVRLPWRS